MAKKPAPANLTDPIFSNEEAARAHFKALRWEGGVPVCFHCGVIGNAVLVKRDDKKVAKRKKHARDGLYYCRDCGGQFTATMGTVYEDSHIPLHKWLLATHLMNSCKRGVSAAELQRQLGLGSYRTAWFMAHRIREGMGESVKGPLGGDGQIVEADETYYGRSNAGRSARHPSRSSARHKHKDQRPKRAVVALVQRGGKAKVFHVASADKETVAFIVQKHVDPASRLHTDESRLYWGADQHAATHETVTHSGGEYVRDDIHTNSVENFFGQFKRGMVGVYGHCDEKYLARYLKELSFAITTV